MIILIDNYDSFTYNLVQYLGDLGQEVKVIRNDQSSVEDILSYKPKGLMISPGPSDPDHAGICMDLIQAAANENIPLFGVCLGHQCIGQVFGGRIIQNKPMHGKVDQVFHEDSDMFKDIPSPFEVTRYHSLIIDPETMPDTLAVTARTEDEIIMGITHKEKPIFGVQFHPESIATQHGHKILENFITCL